MKNTLSIISIIFALFFLSAAKDFSLNDPFVDAADSGNNQKVKTFLAQKYHVDSVGDFGITALMRTAFRGNDEVARTLINAGADVNLTDTGKATALHMAARRGHTQILGLLLAAHAKIDPQDNQGWTPLMRAISKQEIPSISTLVNHDANIQIKDKLGNSAIKHAVLSNNAKIVEIVLKGNGSKKLDKKDIIDLMQITKKQKNDDILNILEKKFYQQIKPQEITDQPKEIIPAQIKKEKKAAIIKSSAKFHSAAKVATKEPTPKASEIITGNAKFESIEKPKPQNQVNIPAKQSDKHYVQLGAFSLEASAVNFWESIKVHKKLFKGIEVHVLKPKTGGSQLFRLRAGPISSANKAKDLCSNLKAKNIACLVVK